MKKLLPFALLLPLAGCPNPGLPDVTISWSGEGVCDFFYTPYGLEAASPGAFVAFSIQSINNPSGVPFNFDPSKVFINASPREYALPSSDYYAQDVTPGFYMQPATVPPGQNLPFEVSAQGAVIDESGDANVAKGINYELLYDTSSLPSGIGGVIMVKANENQVPYPAADPCNNLSFF